MKQIVSWLAVLAGFVAILIYLFSKLSDSRANQIRTQAFLVGAKSDARNDFLVSSPTRRTYKAISSFVIDQGSN